MLKYPDYQDKFITHIDTNNIQLQATISQKGRPIAFFSTVFNKAQSQYTTTYKELLSIVETLRECCTILYGQIVEIYINHKNLAYLGTQHSQYMLQQRLLLEESGVQFFSSIYQMPYQGYQLKVSP